MTDYAPSERSSTGASGVWFVYVLRCEDGSLYTGITTDVGRRVREHLGIVSGGARYTHAHRPVALAAAWEVPSRSAAARLEYAVKRLGRAAKLALVAAPEGVSGLLDGEVRARALPVECLASLWPE